MTGPADTRLAGPAVAVWAAAALGVAAPASRGWLLALGLTGAALAAWRGQRRGARRHRARWQHGAASLLLSAALVAAATGSVVAQDTVRTGGRDAVLAWSGTSSVTVRTTSVPAPVSPGLDGEPRVRVEAQLIDAQVRGTSLRLRSPVTVIGPASWGRVAVGTTVSVQVRARATSGGERSVLLLLAQDPRTVRPPPWWHRGAHEVRTALVAAVSGLPPHAGLLPGIGVGDESLVPADLADAMRTTSLGHLLAVSGAHVAILLAVVLAMTPRWRRSRRAALAMLALTALLLVVGPQPSVVRAVAMGGVVVLAVLCGRPSAALPALAAAVTVLVVADPWLAVEPGFALSVCATAGLVLGAGPLTTVLARRVPGLIAPLVAVPLAAQLACLPVLLLLDPAFASYGVLANALVAPVIPPVTILVLLAALLAPWFPTGAHALVWLAQAGTWWIDRVAHTLAGLPLARLPLPPGPAALGLLVVLVGGVVVLARTRVGRTWSARAFGGRRGLALGWVACGGLAVLVLLAAVVPPLRPTLVDLADRAELGGVPGRWRLLQCDVGQGSALLISTAADGGGPAAVMVDVGPRDGDVGRCLTAAGVRRLDLLVLTHADADHVGGLEDVLAHVEIGSAWLPAGEDPRAPDVEQALVGAGVEVTRRTGGGGTGDTVNVGALTLTPLWPTPRAVELGGEPNDLSLTTWVAGPAGNVLVHGDLGAAAQERLVRAWPELREAAPDVVVVAHHGSPDQDETLLAAASGRLALVSVGADNDYGHPAPDVVTALRGAGALVARTDVCGDVAVTRSADGGLRVHGCP